VIISSDPERQPVFEFARARGQHGHADCDFAMPFA
jgi:hypothetical protein